MPIQPGQVVELVDPSTSSAGGVSTPLGAGLVGRVCRVMASGFCCVRFAGAIGCRRVAEHRLRPSTANAPLCTATCSKRC